MMQSRNTLVEFMHRTERNLRTADKIAERDPHGFFEVTQLVNSVIGMLIFPAEEALNSLSKGAQSKAVANAHPRILHGDPELFAEIGPALRKLRNSFAHFNIEFENQNNQISGLYAWSYPDPKASEPEWVAYISVEDLRALLKQGCKMFEKADPKQSPSKLDALQKRLGKSLRIQNNGGR